MKTQRQFLLLLLPVLFLMSSCEFFKSTGSSGSRTSGSNSRNNESYTDRYRNSSSTSGSRTYPATSRAKTPSDPYAEDDRDAWEQNRDDAYDTRSSASRTSTSRTKKENQFDDLFSERETNKDKNDKFSRYDFDDPDEPLDEEEPDFDLDKDVFSNLNTRARDTEEAEEYYDENDNAESLPLVYFDKFSSRLDRTAQNALSIVYDYLKENPSVSLYILGQASEYAQNESNSKLAFKRAAVVLETLQEWGIPSALLAVPENYNTMKRETDQVEEQYFVLFVDGEVDDYDWSNDLARKRRAAADIEEEEEEITAPVRHDYDDDNQPSIIRHKVVKGDTLHNLARKYQTSIDRIKELNDLNSNVIKIGQVLLIE